MIVEQWTGLDLRGQTLYADTRTVFAGDLAREQADDWRIITTGQWSPEGSLAEVFWEAQTELPWLEPVFDDPGLGRFAKALYLHLVREGDGMAEVNPEQIEAEVNRCREGGFAGLDLGIPARELQAIFKKLLAVVVQYGSQLTGEVASGIIIERLKQSPDSRTPELTDGEKTMLQFRYGAAKSLGNINVGFVSGNGPVLTGLINHLFVLHATGAAVEQREEAADALRQCLYLLRQFQRRRKLARAQERSENRERQVKEPAIREWRRPEELGDVRATAPERPIEARDEMESLCQAVLPHLRKHDRDRVQAYINADGNRMKAAELLGITPEQFSRQWRQTTRPNVLRILKERG